MRLSYCQQRQLRLIEATVRRSDPHLGTMFGIFGRLYPRQDLPEWEQQPPGAASQGRLRRTGAWIVAVLTTAAVAAGVLLSMAALRRRAPAQAPAAQRERTRPRPDGPAWGDTA